MEDKNYKGLRKTLIGILEDLEQIKKKSVNALRFSRAIGGPIQKETATLISKFEKLSLQCLKLEQETREI